MATFQNIQEEISSMLSVPDNELTPEQKAEMDAYLDDLGRMEVDKVDAFGQFMRLEQDRVDALKQEAKRLETRAKAAQNRLDGLRGHYMATMQASGITKIRGDIYCLNLRKSQRVETPKSADALEKLWQRDPLFVKRKVEFTPDKNVIKEALKAGIVIEGCSLEDSYSLQVR